MRFDGKAGLVSGAGSGIGRATALALAARGARVAVADIDGAKAKAVVAEITASGGTAVAIVADAATPDGVEAMIGGTVRAFGGLDVLHNNAFGQPALPPGRSRLSFTGDLDEAGAGVPATPDSTAVQRLSPRCSRSAFSSEARGPGRPVPRAPAE